MSGSGQNGENTKRIIVLPAEEQWFEVNPQAIDRTIFEQTRKDWNQERTRLLIVAAFDEMKIKPDQYGRKFSTMFPKKTWSFKSVSEMKRMACKMGDRMADWVEQALEWAQRICNGESWEDVCNKGDTTMWYRVITCKNGNAKLVGGSLNYSKISAAVNVHRTEYQDNFGIYNAVPLVVRYEK